MKYTKTERMGDREVTESWEFKSLEEYNLWRGCPDKEGVRSLEDTIEEK